VSSNENLRARFPSAFFALDLGVGEPPPELHIELPDNLWIEGTVIEPSGNASVGATVIGHLGVGWSVSATSDAEGRFRIAPLLEGEHELFAVHDDHPMSESVRVLPGTGDVLLTLPPGGSVSGICVDNSTDEPVLADLRVAGVESDQLLMTGSDAAGAFVFGPLRQGTYDIVATTSDGRFGAARDVHVEPGVGGSSIRIELSGASSLQVLHRGVSESLEFTLRRDGRLFAWQGASRGAAVRVPVPPGAYELEVHGPNGESRVRLIEVGKGETTGEIVDP
jgi:hypothetical protein